MMIDASVRGGVGGGMKREDLKLCRAPWMQWLWYFQQMKPEREAREGAMHGSRGADARVTRGEA